MKLIILRPRPDLGRTNAILLAFLVVLGCLAFRHEMGEDLASSYVGCRLITTGQAAHLYSFDPVSFDEIGNDDTWQAAADSTGYTGALHPYVQTPLWAYSLQPLCKHVNWTGFFRVFTWLTMLSLAGSLWLVAKYWTPSFFNPIALSVVVGLWVLSQPFQYAAFLMQTHMLLIFLTVAGLILAERDHWISAGAFVACAAAVKVTPVLLVIYWLLTKRWKAAVSMLIWSAILWGVTVAAVGHTVTDVYLADLRRISRVLIIPMNNQSFAAWLMAPHYPADEMFDVHEFVLPNSVRLVSSALMLVFTVAGGLLDRARLKRAHHFAPLGAIIALMAATVFAPIAWTHYSVILVMPLMMIVHENRRPRSKLIWSMAAVIMLLNYRPLSTDINHFLTGEFAIVRGQFYASALMLVSLSAMAYVRLKKPASNASPLLLTDDRNVIPE